MDKAAIIKIITTIRDADVENKEEYFKERYKNFKKKYPNLYTMCCKPSFATDPAGMKTLEYMLDMMSMVNKNEKTQEEASVAVGQELFTKFVDVSKLQKSDKACNGPQVVIK